MKNIPWIVLLTLALVYGCRTYSSDEDRLQRTASARTVRSSRIPQQTVRMIPSDLVRIEGGIFNMGSPEDEQGRKADEIQHQVSISPFYIAKYPVTQKEYQELMGVNPSIKKGNDLPVENVSWFDAIDFCNRRSEKEGLTPAYTRSGNTIIRNIESNGYRLPTEAEWEYVCRGGTFEAYYTGSTITERDANINDNLKSTVSVGNYPPNPWGLYDIYGNVAEWCWDWYGEYNTSPQTDPQGPAEGWFDQKVVRGGGWSEIALNQRSAARFRTDITSKMPDLGFRIACSIN
jgi:formylglycine-generating enzyme required for sulfatase activity